MEIEQSEDSKMKAESSGVQDRNHVVYWIVFFTGLVILLPWNILITVNGYWDYKFRNVSLDSTNGDDDDIPLTQLQKEFASYLAIAANVPNATFVILHALFGHKFSMRLRILGSQTGQIVVFSAIVVLAVVNSDDWQQEFLIANLLVIVFINIFSAIFQGSVTANLGTFPVEYIGSCITGAGTGGLVPSVVNIIILAAHANFQMAGFYCFLFAEIMAITCLVLFLYLEKNAFYRHHSLDHTNNQTSVFNFKDDLQSYYTVWRKSGVFILITFLNFCVTLIVFPAVTVLIEPENKTNSDWHQIFFVPVLCFVVFNAGDVAGKSLAAWLQWPQTSPRDQAILMTAALLRILLVPAFMFCNVAPSNRNTEVFFTSEVYYVIFIIILSVSNGYIGNITMMFGPKVVDKEVQEMTAAFLLAALVVGCGVGSVISTPVVKGL